MGVGSCSLFHIYLILCIFGFDTKILTIASEGGAMYFLLGEHMQRLKKKRIDQQSSLYIYFFFNSEKLVNNIQTFSPIAHIIIWVLLDSKTRNKTFFCQQFILSASNFTL